MLRRTVRSFHVPVALFLALVLGSALAVLAQTPPPPQTPAAAPTGRAQAPGGQRGAMPNMPKPGVCPLPTLPALASYTDASFYAVTDVPHGKVEQVPYKNFAGADKRMHVYLPPAYEKSPGARYPVLYL